MPLDLPDHLSYSQYSTYTGCPRRYFLSRVRGAPATPAWYFLIGSAIHEGIESYIKTGEKSDPVKLLNAQAVSALEAEPDIELWLHGGSKDEPIIKERALELVKDCLATAYDSLKDLEIAPGSIELDVSGRLPGVERPIRAYVDGLAVHKKHGPVIFDWKSSSSKPKDNFQLKTYRALLLVKGGYDEYNKGLWVMLRPGVPTARPVDLSDVKPEDIGAQYAKMEERIEGRVWPAMTSFACKFCEQKVNCSLMSGSTPRTEEWDTSSEDGVPF